MFEVLAALFGGGYYAVKHVCQKADDEVQNTIQKGASISYTVSSAIWNAAVIDNKLHSELLDKYVKDSEFHKEVDNEMREYFGNLYTPTLAKSPTAIRYLLAKQGKLTHYDALSISLFGADTLSEKDMERWDKEVAFVDWMYNQILKNNKVVKPYLLFRDGRDGFTTNVPLVLARDVKKYSGGEFRWNMNDYSFCKQTYIPS